MLVLVVFLIFFFPSALFSVEKPMSGNNLEANSKMNEFTKYSNDVICDLSLKLKWNNFLYIFDSSSDLQPQLLWRSINKQNISMAAVHFDKHQAQIKTFFQTPTNPLPLIITQCTNENVKKIVTAAQVSKMNISLNWIFINSTENINTQLFENASSANWQFLILRYPDSRVNLCASFSCHSNLRCQYASTNEMGNFIDNNSAINNNNCQITGYTVKLFSGLSKWKKSQDKFGFNYSDVDWEIFHTIFQNNQEINVTMVTKESREVDGYPWHTLASALSSDEGLDFSMPFGHLSSDILDDPNLDTSVPIYEVVYGIINLRSITVQKFGDYTKPMASNYNQVIAAIFLLTAILYPLTYYWSPYSDYKAAVDPPDTPLEITYSYSIFAGFYLFLAQAHDSFPSYLSGRIIYICVIITGFLYVQYYSAVLISNLAARDVKPEIQDLESVIKNKDYAIGADNLFNIVDILNNSNYALFKDLATRILSDPDQNLLIRPEDAIPRILNEKFVYLTPMDRIQPYLRANCTLAVVVPEVIRVSNHMIFKTTFPFKKLVKRKIFELRSTGSMQRTLNKFYPQIPNRCDSETEELNQVSYDTIRPVIVLLAILLTVSQLVFILEMTIDYIKEIFLDITNRSLEVKDVIIKV